MRFTLDDRSASRRTARRYLTPRVPSTSSTSTSNPSERIESICRETAAQVPGRAAVGSGAVTIRTLKRMLRFGAPVVGGERDGAAGYGSSDCVSSPPKVCRATPSKIQGMAGTNEKNLASYVHALMM